jgi:hypothetical protein
MERVIKISIDSIEDYLTLFDGIFKFTDTEKEILCEFIKAHYSVVSNNLDINAFSTVIKKKIAKRLDRENFYTLNTYIKRLKDKKAIIEVEGGYEINKVLLPNKVNKISFVLE